jgi:TolA-binding protein
MTTRTKTLSLRLAAAALMGASLAGVSAIAVPAAAQDSAAAEEARLRKIEAEVRALQRKVFPGGDGKFFEPQIATGPQGAGPAPVTLPSGVPAASAVTDILVRIDALEAQLQALTARSEEQANTIAQMELRLAALETAASAPVTVASAAPTGTASQPATTQPAATIPAATTVPAPKPPVQTTAATTSSPAPAPSPSRLAAVQAITKPQTADAGDDEYSYGFRLWNAQLYPEARQQLTRYVEQYPAHSKISYGRNLLGRAFLDDKLPEDAARWFLKNYQANKAGERAPDSLLYLGASMVALGDTKRACIALAEFGETYPLVAAGRLATDYQTTRAKVKCN